MECPEPIDPSTNKAFDLIDRFLTEVTDEGGRDGLFYDDFVHLGGDEVDTSCWRARRASSSGWKTTT